MLRRRNSDESETLAALTPPFDLHRPDVWNNGVIFASPHSGNVYPKPFLKSCDLPLSTLRKNEDIYVDALFAPTVRFGAPLLSARFPRCFVDVNRAADEMPPEWLSGGQISTPRGEMGLGVVPEIISQDRPIYTAPLTAIIAQKRLKALYYPYHAQLSALIDEAKANVSSALLIDCHSMPGFSPSGKRRPDIILGDRYGMSCHAETLTRIEALFEARGYSVVRNHPYAGGYVTAHYGKPDTGVEVLQIEINRDLYMNPVTLKKTKGYARLASDLEMIIAEIIKGAQADIALAAQ